MSAINKILPHVCQLLNELPDVIVSAFDHHNYNCQIELTVANSASMIVIQNCCMGANVSLKPWVKLPEQDLSAGHFSPIQCKMSADITPFNMIKCGNLQLLGIHLVWQLYKLDAMTETSANILLEQWHGAPVGV